MRQNAMCMHSRYGILLVAALGCPWSGAIQARQAADQGDDRPRRAESAQGFAVISAQYGTDERWIDVTEVIRSRIRDGSLDFRPGRLPDPAFGIHKNLVILYSLRGKAGLSITRDDRRVVI